MNQNWRKDPRLNNISPQKLEFLELFSKNVSQTSSSKLLSLLLKTSQQSTAMGFTEEETDLLISILTEHASPKERQQLQFLRQFSANLQTHSSSHT